MSDEDDLDDIVLRKLSNLYDKMIIDGRMMQKIGGFIMGELDINEEVVFIDDVLDKKYQKL